MCLLIVCRVLTFDGMRIRLAQRSLRIDVLHLHHRCVILITISSRVEGIGFGVLLLLRLLSWLSLLRLLLLSFRLLLLLLMHASG